MFDPDLCPGFSPSNKGGGSLHVVGPKTNLRCSMHTDHIVVLVVITSST